MTTAHSQHSPERLLQEADLALYRAKDRGRDRAEVFDEALRTTMVGRLGTERMLRRAATARSLPADHRLAQRSYRGRRGPGQDLRPRTGAALARLVPGGGRRDRIVGRPRRVGLSRHRSTGDRLARSIRRDRLHGGERQHQRATLGRSSRGASSTLSMHVDCHAITFRSKSRNRCSWKPPTRP